MTADGEAPSAIVTEVDKWPMDGIEGEEGTILTVELPPGVHGVHALRGTITSDGDGHFS